MQQSETQADKYYRRKNNAWKTVLIIFAVVLGVCCIGACIVLAIGGWSISGLIQSLNQIMQ